MQDLGEGLEARLFQHAPSPADLHLVPPNQQLAPLSGGEKACELLQLHEPSATPIPVDNRWFMSVLQSVGATFLGDAMAPASTSGLFEAHNTLTFLPLQALSTCMPHGILPQLHAMQCMAVITYMHHNVINPTTTKERCFFQRGRSCMLMQLPGMQ